MDFTSSSTSTTPVPRSKDVLVHISALERTARPGAELLDLISDIDSGAMPPAIVLYEDATVSDLT